MHFFYVWYQKAGSVGYCFTGNREVHLRTSCRSEFVLWEVQNEIPLSRLRNSRCVLKSNYLNSGS